MQPNTATRSHLRVTMADRAGAVHSDPLADTVVDLVLEAMGVEPDRTGGERLGPGPAGRTGSTRLLAERRAAPAVDRLERLTAVAGAAERYRRAVRRGKGRKKARRKLFGALDAWSEAQGAARR